MSIVVKKFIAPNIELILAKWRLKIMASIGVSKAERGGYIVQPEPTLPCKRPHAKHIEAGSSIQKEKLFRRGQAISGTPIIEGISQFLNPPISIGITIHSTSSKTSKLHTKHTTKARTSDPKT